VVYFVILLYLTFKVLMFVRFNVKNQVLRAKAAAVLKNRNSQYYNFKKEIEGVEVDEVLAMDVT